MEVNGLVWLLYYVSYYSTRGSAILLEIAGAVCLGHTVLYDARLCMVVPERLNPELLAIFGYEMHVLKVPCKGAHTTRYLPPMSFLNLHLVDIAPNP